MSESNPVSLPPALESDLSELLAGPGDSADESWRQLCRRWRDRDVTPAAYEVAWQRCYAAARESRNPLIPCWIPDPQPDREPNVVDWAREQGVAVEDFQRWSVAHRFDFWEQAIRRLGIVFRARAESIVADPSARADRVEWLPGAEWNIVESCFQAPSESPAIVWQRPGGALHRWSVADLYREMLRVSGSVRAAGFQPGDGLGVVLPMTAWSVAIYLGVIHAGCHIVSIADSFASAQIRNRLEIAGAKAVFTYDVQHRAGKLHPLYERVRQATELPIVVLPDDGEQVSVELREQDHDWEHFLRSETAKHAVAGPSSHLVNVLFSSGTTGDPKAIPWTSLTPLKCGVDGQLHQDIAPGDVVAWPTNLGWMMGPWLIFASLLNRATIALYDDVPVGEGFGRFVQDARINMLGVVPTLVKSWRKTGCMESFDWSAIRLFSSTGESSQRDDMFYLSALAGMKPVIEYCGGTEIGGGYVTSLVTRPNVPAAFNTPAVGLDFLLLDETGKPAEEGEVFLEGPSIGLSQTLLNRDHHETYYAATPRVEGHGILRRHGDYFRRLERPGDPHPWYVAGGRVDDTMNLGGIKVSSAEIERVLNGAPGVRETAAIAVDREGGPSSLVVFAVLQPGAEEESGELLLEMNQRLRDQLNPLFRVASLELLPALPRTASGKVMRRELRKTGHGSDR